MASANPDYFNQLVEHYSKVWGPPTESVQPYTGRYHDLPAEYRVLIFPPADTRSQWVYATLGMSWKVSTPPLELHVRSNRASHRFTEILDVVAHFHRTEANLGLHHLLQLGEPWVPGSLCTCGYVSLPYVDGPDLEHMYTDKSTLAAHCLWLMPITDQERRAAVSRGANWLEERFEEKKVEYWNLLRTSIV